MSPSWRDELRVGFCPDRLVVARRARGLRGNVSRQIVPSGDDPSSTLREIAGSSATTVILSNYFVRYAVLSGSAALRSDDDWFAYAQHTFTVTYGNEAAQWQVRLCATDVPHQRVACAADAALIESLRALPRLSSIQPYLMAAFNRRRAALRSMSTWLVLQEPFRLTIALIEEGQWKLVRVRQATKDWQSSLGDVLDREAAISGSECTRTILCCEDEPPEKAGGYDLLDLSLPRRASQELRSHIMTLH